MGMVECSILHMIQYFHLQGKLSDDWSMHGHRNGMCRECPGDELYTWVQAWSNYGENLPGSCPREDAPRV